MSKIDVSVSVEKAPYDLLLHLSKLIKAAKASGGFTAVAIPAEIGALVAELPAIVGDCQEMSGDYAEDKLAFGKGGFLGLDVVLEAAFTK